MHLVAFASVLFLITSSSALSLDKAGHFARHQQIAARHPVVNRSSVSARCQKRTPPAPSPSIAASSAPLAASPASSSQHSQPSPSQAPPPSTSKSSSSPSTGSPGTGKVGIGWSLGDDSAVKNFLTDKVSSIYTWTPAAPQPNSFGLEFTPMFWGPDQTSQFQNLVKPGYANTLLSFNEPELGSQANLDPQTAAKLWMEFGQPMRSKGYSTIAPAVAFSIPWLTSFFDACNGCEFDALAAHSYATDPQITINYLTTLHNTFGLPIWVTEFACHDFTGGPQADSDQVTTYMTTLINWMDETEWIVKYFYYGFFTASEININPLNALMNDDGTPNKLGRLYIGS